MLAAPDFCMDRISGAGDSHAQPGSATGVFDVSKGPDFSDVAQAQWESLIFLIYWHGRPDGRYRVHHIQVFVSDKVKPR